MYELTGQPEPDWDLVNVTSQGLPGPLAMYARPGTSDLKAIREVIERRSYASHGFTPRPGERWLDIGFNVGAFSAWAAAHGAQVLAFEPDPESARVGACSLEHNGLQGVRLVEAAAGVEEGKATLSVNVARGNVWRNSIYKDWRGSDHIEVPVVDIGSHWTRNVHVKLDAEGAELPILGTYGHLPVRKLVFEASLDIWREMERWHDLLSLLRRTYKNVRGQTSVIDNCPDDVWQPKGPANGALIYCWSE